MKIHLLRFTTLNFFILAASLAGQAQTPPPTNQTLSTAPQAPVPQAPALTAPQGKVAHPPGAIDITQEPIVKIVANVQPAVVNITAQATVPEYIRAYNQYFKQFHSSQSIGSGLIISADGLSSPTRT